MDIKIHCVIALLIRLGFVVYGMLHDRHFDVKYTDIDYNVFTDAANYVCSGESPFKRHTFRYSPILAALLTPNIFIHNSFGKILFCCFDTITSLLIYYIQKSFGYSSELCKISAFLWLYNPLAIVISSRGNSESILTTFIMLSIFCYKHNYFCCFGFLYGFSIHMKIYPCIYLLSFYSMLSAYTRKNMYGWEKLKSMLYPDWRKFLFVLSTITGFILPTAISLYLYGGEYVQEALLYHLIRKDVHHNFSPYFYALYLSETLHKYSLTFISYGSFIIQAFLIVAVSWVFYRPHTLSACLFLETFIFVTFNKVCTSQYFLWYLSLFPLNYPILCINIKYVIAAFIMWIFGQISWLVPAYYLEFEGMNTFMLLCISSLNFFLINICLINMFIKLTCKSLNLIKDD